MDLLPSGLSFVIVVNFKNIILARSLATMAKSCLQAEAVVLLITLEYRCGRKLKLKKIFVQALRICYDLKMLKLPKDIHK